MERPVLPAGARPILCEVRPDTLVRLKWVGKNDMGTDFSDYGFSGKDAGGRDTARRPGRSRSHR